LKNGVCLGIEAPKRIQRSSRAQKQQQPKNTHARAKREEYREKLVPFHRVPGPFQNVMIKPPAMISAAPIKIGEFGNARKAMKAIIYQTRKRVAM